MSAFLLLIASDREARVSASQRGLRWWQARGQRPVRASAPPVHRIYQYDEATLLVWPGSAVWQQAASAEQVHWLLDSQGLAERAAPISKSEHGLLIEREQSGQWTLHRGWHAERNVYYLEHDGQIACASSPRLALAALARPLSEHPAAVAAFFAQQPLPPPACFFAGVHCLAPGAELAVTAAGRWQIQAAQSWAPRPIAAASDQDWLVALDQALRQALQDQPGPDPVGLMLSGGIDSTTLAAGLQAVGRSTRLFTWQLPLARANESDIAAQTAAALGLPLTIVPVTELPFSDLDQLPINPDAPLANPYRVMNDALMQAAAALGIRTLLSGNFGDHLYPESNLALASAKRAGRLDLVGSAAWYKLLRRLQHGPWWPRFRPSSSERPSPLTAFAQQYRAEAALPYRPEIAIEDPSRLADLFDPAPRLDAEGAWYFADAFGLDLRFPYRHQAMLDLALQWPVHLSERHGQRKWLTRQWLKGRVPDPIRLRAKAGSLAPWFWQGLQTHADAVRACLQTKNAVWTRYLEPSGVLACVGQTGSEFSGLLVWQALCYEIWHKAAIRDGTLR